MGPSARLEGYSGARMDPAPKTIDQLIAEHPWPKEFAGRERMEWLWHFEVPVAVKDIWPILVDTSRLNRAMGSPEIKFEEREDGKWGVSKRGGMVQEWLEVPWNWLLNQWVEIPRIYKRGFAEIIYSVYDFTPLGPDRTRVSTYYGAIARGLVGHLAMKYGFPSLEETTRKVLHQVAEQIIALKPALAMPGPEALSPTAEQKLQESKTRMVGLGLEAQYVDTLFDWIRKGDEADLTRIQIRERAKTWGLDEQKLLRVALHATREAVLEISWDIICPHCRSVTAESNALGGITNKSSCGVCELDFSTNSAESVEITFHVHPSIREVLERTYCSAEPAGKDHIKLQRDLQPGQELTFKPNLEPGTYRLRLHARTEYGYLDVSPSGEQTKQLVWKANSLERHSASGSPELKLHNVSDKPQRFILESARWSDHALRPGQLFSLQEYRDLFSEDYLSTDVQLASGDQTILFTDIVGSTAMYATRGDPAAFMEVKNHFGEVFPVVAKNRGAVVKTIGDAVMAAFSDPLDAVKASQEIHACFPPGRDTRLRISLNSGPCIAVKLNTGVDYFGQTVNLAAKLQSLAESWQVAMSEAVVRSPGVGAFLEKEGVKLEDVTFASKALKEPLPVKRWTCFVES